MKLRLASMSVVFFAAVVSAVPATAEDIDFSRIRCGDFISTNKDDVVLLLTWMEGYFTPRNGPPVMYGQKAKEDAQNLRDYCLNHSEADVFSAAKAVMPIK
ncbi:MAG: HdeA/HdeB family chaperone [Methylovirgula sp.]